MICKVRFPTNSSRNKKSDFCQGFCGENYVRGTIQSTEFTFISLTLPENM